MAELNLKQIIDRLNAEFVGDTRKLVFWYDDKADFAEDLENVELENAKIYRLQPDNQFYTKYFLERVDTTTNYLVYASFPKPDVRENHLEDTLLYSRRFFADRASLLSVDLGIEEKYKPILEKHIKFFADKKRTQRFYDLEIENFNEENILTGLLSAICKARTCSFEEVVRVVLTEGSLSENAYLQQFEQYDLLPSFWRLCEQHFGYTDVKPMLERLLVTLFVTYTARYVQAELPAAWKSFVSYKAGNIIAFLDSLMNSVLYRDKYDELSDHVAKGLNVYQAFSGCRADDLVECDTFLAVDQVLVKWLMGRLLAEDTGAKLNELTIPEVCEKRAKMHFGRKTDKTYQLLQSAYCMVQAANYRSAEDFKAIVDRYLSADHQIDQQYRKFYFYYDKLENTETFEPLRELVENIYTNEYLATLLPAWNEGLRQEEALAVLPLQRDFYNANLRYAKERTVVIISDAMRYEVGQELFARMQDDPKCSAQLNVQLGVLPSYTRLGMAALLPHRTLEMTDDFQVLVDGILCDTLAGRQQVLQSYVPDSVCIQFDEIKSMKVADLRDVLTKRQVIYVYHNQIDARGDKPNTEDEVFNACEEAVQEIMDLIRRINGSGNTHHFIVTADHGFTICDFVADMRAPTPSAAAEIATPSLEDLHFKLDNIQTRMNKSLSNIVEYDEQKLKYTFKRINTIINDYIINDKIIELDKITEKINLNIENKIEKESMNLRNLGSLLHNLSPLKTLDRGYSIINKDDVVVNSVLKISENDEIEVILSDGSLDCTVNKINKKEV